LGLKESKHLTWIENFLTGRSQTVHISDEHLAKVEVESGGPQGSVLGHFLFIVYINDCANELDFDIAMFADDHKLWRVIKTAANEEDLQARHSEVLFLQKSSRSLE
uniref:Reverse transcriptase domain-containing protein n=1 Tax=Schistocephalus solidus TaxID=70667 RepID=A0A183TQN8_SCHSO